jgi:hypothetical protein
LRAFCSLALWLIYENLYLLFRMQECRFTTPSQDAEMEVYNSFPGCRNADLQLFLRMQEP